MKTLTCPSRSNSSLTRLQAALQRYFRTHSGQTVSRAQICAEVWRMNYFHSSRTIDQTVSVVRKHLAQDERVTTVFGIGYRHEFLSPEVTFLPSNRPEQDQAAASLKRAA